MISSKMDAVNIFANYLGKYSTLKYKKRLIIVG